MSTNHTPNFNLCQWEADDKVLRTDFNEDNQKIDAALAGLAASKLELIPIKTITISTGGSKLLTLDVSDIDWGQWRYVVAECRILADSGGTIYVSENGVDAWGVLTYWGSSSSQSVGIGSLEYGRNCQMIFFPLKDAQRTISCLSVSSSGMCLGHNGSLTYEELISLDVLSFGSSAAFNAGSTFAFFGIK